MLDMRPGDEDRKMALKYKKLLLEHRIIKGGWEKFHPTRSLFQSVSTVQYRFRPSMMTKRGNSTLMILISIFGGLCGIGFPKNTTAVKETRNRNAGHRHK